MCALLLLLNIELVRIISVAGFNSSLFILTGIQCVVHSTIVAICSTVDGHLGGTRGHRSAAMSILVYMFWCMYVHTCVRYTPRSETELVAGNYKAQVLGAGGGLLLLPSTCTHPTPHTHTIETPTCCFEKSPVGPAHAHPLLLLRPLGSTVETGAQICCNAAITLLPLTPLFLEFSHPQPPGWLWHIC